MSTTFNFPANPTTGDLWTLPNGSVAQWNGTEWVSVDNSNVTYPLPITLGGTGANAAGPARVNLGLNTATGEFIVQKDGTVAAPGIAFASEPGLGWYRIGAGQIGWASQGVQIGFISAATAASTTVRFSPRAVGGLAGLSFTNQPAGTANVNVFNLTQNGDGSATIATTAAGTATRGSLTIDAPTVAVTGNFAAYTSGGPAQQGGFGVSGDKRAVYWYTSPEYSIGTVNVSGLVALITNGVVRTTWDIVSTMIHSGAAQKPGGGPWDPTASDARIKRDIEPYTRGLEDILAYRPVQFRYLDGYGAPGDDVCVGRLAHEVEAVDPSMVIPSMVKSDFSDLKTYRMDTDVYKIINAIKTLHQRLKAIGA